MGEGIQQAVAPDISLPRLAKEVTRPKRTFSPDPSENKRRKASTLPGDRVTGSNSITNLVANSLGEPGSFNS